jgi:hypothetical protein
MPPSNIYIYIYIYMYILSRCRTCTTMPPSASVSASRMREAMPVLHPISVPCPTPHRTTPHHTTTTHIDEVNSSAPPRPAVHRSTPSCAACACSTELRPLPHSPTVPPCHRAWRALHALTPYRRLQAGAPTPLHAPLTLEYTNMPPHPHPPPCLHAPGPPPTTRPRRASRPPTPSAPVPTPPQGGTCAHPVSLTRAAPMQPRDAPSAPRGRAVSLVHVPSKWNLPRTAAPVTYHTRRHLRSRETRRSVSAVCTACAACVRYRTRTCLPRAV